MIPSTGKAAAMREDASTPSHGLSRPAWSLRWTKDSWDWLLVAATTIFYGCSFGLDSAVHGPLEIFGQDSVYILQALADKQRYPWNPQSHLLYHFIVEKGYRVFRELFGHGLAQAYIYLKILTAGCGAAFFAALVVLLRELGFARLQRAVLMLFTAVCFSAWFHFAAFESHAMAMPGLALYLWVLARMNRCDENSKTNRILLIGSLLWCGWIRVDLFRFAACSSLLLLLPTARKMVRRLAIDLSLVAVLGIGGNIVLSSLYFHQPPWRTATQVLLRDDRPELTTSLSNSANFRPEHFLAVGRAMMVYTAIAPVEPAKPTRSFFSPPAYVLNLPFEIDGVTPSTKLDLEPVSNLAGNALSLSVLVGYAILLLTGVVAVLRRAARYELLYVMIVAQALSGWVFYTWFNPREPFLWILECLPLLILVLAEALRGRAQIAWLGMLVFTALLAMHNTFAFYLPFR